MKKQSSVLKTTSEQIKLQRKLLTLLRKKIKEIKNRFKLTSNVLELKHITEPLLEAKDEFARILIDNTKDALNRGMDKVQKARIDSKGLLEYSQWVSDNLREHYFTASQRTLERIAGDIMNNIQQSYEEGLGYREASQRLEQVFTNMQTYELERIARTELGRAESLGMYTSEIELGVEYHQWSTMEDDLVRDSHSDLEGQIVRVGDEFSNGLKYPLDTSGDISEWINCFIGDTLISCTETERVYRRLYKGEVVSIRTASGNELTGTPNHPVLTSEGWKALGKINLGDDVIIALRTDFPVTPNNNYIKTRIEQIYTTNSKLFPIERVGLSSVDFHTDARGSKDVDIININSLLGDSDKSSVSQFSNNFSLVFTYILKALFSCLGSFYSFFDRYCSASNSLVGFSDETLTFGLGSLSHSNIHRFGAVSDRDFVNGQISMNNISTNLELMSQCFNRFPFLVKIYNFFRQFNNIRSDRDIIFNQYPSDRLSANSIFFSNGAERITVPITFDNVVNIERKSFSGYVYNLQTKDNIYISNNIITHNCRCVLLPYIMPEGFTAPDLPYFYEYDLIPISTTEPIQEEAIQSLAKYQHTDFFPINQYLRAGRLPEDTLQTKQDIKKMDSLMQPLKQDTLLYRGMGHNLLDKIGITLNENLDEVLNGRIEGKTYSEYLNEKLSGVVFQDNGFISTSSDLETAKDFVTWTKTLSNQTKGLMEITAQAGVKAINVDDLNYMGESEYILQRGTKFMIDRVEIIENKGKLLIKYKVKVVE